MGEWRRVRIGDFLHRVKHHVRLRDDETYKLVTVRMHHNGVVLRETKKGKLIGSNMYQVRTGQFILSGIDARHGAFGIVPEELDGAIVTNDFWYFDVDEAVVARDFFLWLTTTPLFLDACIKSSEGTTNRRRLQGEKFYNFAFRFPDVAEQHRLAERFAGFDASHTALKSEFEVQSGLLKQLRQAVLQEAVEGKLTADWRRQHPVVKGDPQHDAAALLAQIKAEKERLVKAGKVRKEKSLPPIAESDKPFELPAGWVWCRLGAVAINKDDARIPISQNERERRGKIYPYYGASGVIDKIDGYTHEGENLLIGEDGANLVTRTTPVAFIATGKYWVNNHAHVLGFVAGVTLNFIEKFINAIDLKPYITGGFQPKLSQANLLSIYIALPPLAEQQAIVARVDSLMAMIDELEQQVAERKEQAQMLMQAVLREAFAGGEGADDESASAGPTQASSIPAIPRRTRARHAATLREAVAGGNGGVDRARPGRMQGAPTEDLPLVAENPADYKARGQAVLPAANQPVPGGIPARILAAMQPGRDYSRAELLAATGISEADWIWAIRQLKEQGRVVQKGEKRGARYRNNEKGGDR